MNTSSNSYVLGFAVILCVVISAVLAAIATALRPIQEAAAELDRQKNVLMAAGLAGSDTSPEEVEALYQSRVTERVVDTKTGEFVSDLPATDPAVLSSGEPVRDLEPSQVPNLDKAEQKQYRVLATINGAAGEVEAFVLPISGKGLWSTLYGYLALEGDANTVKGITFYKHKETPGLGGEVENPQWTAKWPGKTILRDGELVSVTVKKGVVDESNPEEKAHYVDGLAGATITCNGVTDFVKRDLQAFLPTLNKAKN